MTDQREQTIMAAAKALARELYSEDEVARLYQPTGSSAIGTGYEIRARRIIIAYEQALGQSYDDLKAERDELAKRLVAERNAHLAVTRGRHFPLLSMCGTGLAKAVVSTLSSCSRRSTGKYDPRRHRVPRRVQEGEVKFSQRTKETT